jgi:prepilin-type processing-associated H-X9-DG protein
LSPGFLRDFYKEHNLWTSHHRRYDTARSFGQKWPSNTFAIAYVKANTDLVFGNINPPWGRVADVFWWSSTVDHQPFRHGKYFNVLFCDGRVSPVVGRDLFNPSKTWRNGIETSSRTRKPGSSLPDFRAVRPLLLRKAPLRISQKKWRPYRKSKRVLRFASSRYNGVQARYYRRKNDL